MGNETNTPQHDEASDPTKARRHPMRRTMASVVLTVGLALGMTALSPASAQAHSAPGVNACTYSPDRIWGLYNFKHACNHHDICYRNRWGRSYCDNRFWQEMMSSCQANYAWYNPQRDWCYRAAGVYWTAVRSFGGFRY